MNQTIMTSGSSCSSLGGLKGMVVQTLILLMVQKSGDHQLRLVVYPIIYKVLYIPGGCLGFLPSTVGILLYNYDGYINPCQRGYDCPL